MFEFTKDCLLGIEMLDDDHRHLFELLNEGIDLVENHFTHDKYDDIKQLISNLNSYANEHFAREEAYMESIRDPEIIIQRIQHDTFRTKIWELNFSSVTSEAEQQQVLDEILNYLATWLYRHILGSDIMIGHMPPLEEWMIKENPCEFSDEYLTGNSLIDAEHRTLFEISEKAYRLVKNSVAKEDIPAIMNILQELKEYTVDHFQDEEEYMESIKYEGLDAQKRAHDAFIYKLENVKASDIEKNPKEYMVELIKFLLSWLINHICKMDKKIPV